MKNSQVSILCPVENLKPHCSDHNSKWPATTDRTVLRAYQTAIWRAQCTFKANLPKRWLLPAKSIKNRLCTTWSIKYCSPQSQTTSLKRDLRLKCVHQSMNHRIRKSSSSYAFQSYCCTNLKKAHLKKKQASA
jgi:hypothetical protein